MKHFMLQGFAVAFSVTTNTMLNPHTALISLKFGAMEGREDAAKMFVVTNEAKCIEDGVGKL